MNGKLAKSLRNGKSVIGGCFRMTEKRFTVENVMDVLIPLFMVELFLFGNIALLAVLLQAFGVI